MQVNTYPYLHMDLISILLPSNLYFDLFIVCWLNPSLLYFGMFVIFHPGQKQHDRSLYITIHWPRQIAVLYVVA